MFMFFPVHVCLPLILAPQTTKTKLLLQTLNK